MADLERNRVMRRQIFIYIWLVLFFTIGIFSHSVQFAYAQSASDSAETVSISGVKFWVDQNGNLLPENEHPDTAELSLFANDKEIDRKSVSSKDDWNWEFKDLPKYDDSGEEINYTVREASLDDYTSDMKIVLVNTYAPSKEITVQKVWNDSNDQAGKRPESVTVRLLANGELVDTLVLDNDSDWKGVFDGLPVMDAASEEEITYTVEEIPADGYILSGIEEEPEGEFTITNTVEQQSRRLAARRPIQLRSDTGNEQEGFTSSESPVKEENENNGTQESRENMSPENSGSEGSVSETPQSGQGRPAASQNIGETPAGGRISLVRIPESFTGISELPRTGFTAGTAFPLSLNDEGLIYESLAMELEIPSLNISAGIVQVPVIDGSFPVEWLGGDAGLLEGTALPGEGLSVIAGHNTLNPEEYGPFAMIAGLEEGDRFFIRKEDGSMMIFAVYANEKIEAADVKGLFETASEYAQTITLLTCEDEMLEGGYASRRIVSARKIN